MKRIYVPILKCKKGEQSALYNLTDSVKQQTVPLLEIPYSSATTKKSVNELINAFWSNRKFFFYFMPDWYDSRIEEVPTFFHSDTVSDCIKAQGIPVIDLSIINEINNINELTTNGIAIRIRNNEFGNIEDTLNPLFENNILDRKNTDLVLDLQYVSAEDLFAKSAVLKSVFADLDLASEYRSIIISSVSFPKTLSNMEAGKIYRFKRIENEIFALCLKLANRFNFNYCYSDYGPADIEDISFVIGMSPNFKIKYTVFDDFICIKGLSLKRGGLDIQNVQDLAKLLVNSDDFSGKDYSWGDEKIYALAQKESCSPGNLTTWVSYAMNHHITFITHQI